MDPMNFRVGDIVEAQMSFVGIPYQGGKTRMMVVLRALTLLDCEQSIVSNIIFAPVTGTIRLNALMNANLGSTGSENHTGISNSDKSPATEMQSWIWRGRKRTY
jgi:hypothetical protein